LIEQNITGQKTYIGRDDAAQRKLDDVTGYEFGCRNVDP
jgi:hypothetical protein